MPDRSQAMDHVVVVLFENRSLDNLLGRLYGPQDGKTFEGVIGIELSNPIPEWAEHGADRGLVPYTVATDMDSPNPDSGEEYFHTNTQLHNISSEANRFKMGEEVIAPWNAPEPRQTPGSARSPRQTFMNRSFWTAATASGLVVNSPAAKWLSENDSETIFDRLDQHGKTWKVYVSEPMQLSATAIIHFSRLKDRLATHFVPFSQFELDAANGELPDLSFIEPCLIVGHNDYHPAAARAMARGLAIPSLDPPSSILGGEAFLSRIYDAHREMQSSTGSNVWNTTLLISWDEPGGTYDHVPPPTVVPPDPSAPIGELGFTFDRSGYRVPRRHRVAVGGRRRRFQPGAPTHVTDRHAPGAVGPGGTVHGPRHGRPHVLPRLHPRRSPGPDHVAGPRSAPGAPVHPGCTGARAGPLRVGQDPP
jgi:phospholipase C